MRENIKKLIKSGITAHQVSKETEIPRNTAYRIFRGEAKLDNISLKNAEILNGYFLKNKEEINMRIEIKKLFTDALGVSKNLGWEVYEVGAYLKDKKVNFYVGYTGQGIDENVYNKAYDDIVYLTDYYNDYVDGHHDLDTVVELATDLVNDMVNY